MSIGIQYDSNGNITGTLSPPLGAVPQGMNQLIVPDGTSFDGMIVDLTNLVLIPNPNPTAPSPPDLATQMFSALVANGTLTPDCLDDSTLAQVNTVMAATGAQPMIKSGGTIAGSAIKAGT